MNLSPSNEEILNGIRNSDDSILTFIIRQIFPRVAAYLRKKGARHQEIEDITMIAIEAIYVKTQNEQIILDKANFESYFTRICLNHWYKIIRRKKIHNRVTNEFPKVLNEEVELDHYQIQQERYHLYEAKLHNLGNKCKQLLQWAFQQKMSIQELSKRLQISEGNVRKRKYDCKSKLIKLIKEDPLYPELVGL